MGAIEYYGHTDARGDVNVTRAKDGVHTPLPLRLDLANHSPTGFSHGYYGSGPAQLALAMLADYAGDAVALKHYQEFKERVIAKLPQDEPFTISGRTVQVVLSQIQSKEHAR